MPDCCATAAFAKIVYNMEIILVESKYKFHLGDDIVKAMALNGIVFPESRGAKVLYIIGSFWKNDIDILLTMFDKIYMYSFGEPVINDKITVFSDEKKLGSIIWLRSLLPQSLLIDGYVTSKQHIISKANVRCFGQGPDEVQQLFTGIYDYSATNKVNVFDTFIKLFLDDIEFYDTLMDRGGMLLTNHRGLAEERARINTKIITAKCGAKVAITEGPELTNFTHEGLIKVNTDADLTAVFSYNLDKNGPKDEMRVSIRSYSSKFDASKILENIKGSGGSDTAAGCRIPYSLDFSLVL
jgi:hypothetical protein